MSRVCEAESQNWEDLTSASTASSAKGEQSHEHSVLEEQCYLHSLVPMRRGRVFSDLKSKTCELFNKLGTRIHQPEGV